MGIDFLEELFSHEDMVKVYLFLGRQQICVHAMSDRLDIQSEKVAEYLMTLIASGIVVKHTSGELTHYKVDEKQRVLVLEVLKQMNNFQEIVDNIEVMDTDCGAMCAKS